MKIFKYLGISFVIIITINIFMFINHNSMEKERSVQNDLEILVEGKNKDLFANEVADKIKDHKIIFLGEQQHGDGETILLKSKIIDVLNQKYGFKYVLIEGGFFYNLQLRNKIKGNKEITTSDWKKAMYHFWGFSNEAMSFRTKIIDKKMDFYGFDYNLFVKGTLNDLSSYIENYFSKYKEFNAKEYNELFETLKYEYGALFLFNYEPKRKDQDVVLNQILNLKKIILNTIDQSKDDKSMILVLDNLHNFYYSKIKIKSDEERNIYRDSIMYRNIDYIIQNLADKESKLIVWSANAHLLYQNSKDLIPMGKYLKERYGNDVFSILFTSNKGHMYNIATNQVQLINKTSIYSGENTLRNNNENNYFLYSFGGNRKLSKMKFLGHHNKENQWNEMMDNFIFIETMKPVTF